MAHKGNEEQILVIAENGSQRRTLAGRSAKQNRSFGNIVFQCAKYPGDIGFHILTLTHIRKVFIVNASRAPDGKSPFVNHMSVNDAALPKYRLGESGKCPPG